MILRVCALSCAFTGPALFWPRSPDRGGCLLGSHGTQAPVSPRPGPFPVCSSAVGCLPAGRTGGVHACRRDSSGRALRRLRSPGNRSDQGADGRRRAGPKERHRCSVHLRLRGQHRPTLPVSLQQGRHLQGGERLGQAWRCSAEVLQGRCHRRGREALARTREGGAGAAVGSWCAR